MAKKDKPSMSISMIEFPEEKSILKSDKPTNIEPESEETSNDWLTHINFEMMYRSCIENSTILPQCIESYKNNIVGFGIGVRYKEDYKNEETPEMEAEFKFAKNVIEMLSLECDTKDIFEQLEERCYCCTGIKRQQCFKQCYESKDNCTYRNVEG